MTHYNDTPTHMYRVRVDYEMVDTKAQQIVTDTYYSKSYTTVAPAKTFRTQELARHAEYPRRHPVTNQPLRFDTVIQSSPLAWSDTDL